MSAILLALSLSIDSLGIGTSYGIRNIKIPLVPRIIISVISFVFTYLSITTGNILTLFISDDIGKLTGCLMLMAMSVYIIFSNIFKKPESFDKDSSKSIDIKESLFLGIALSVDSIGAGICCAAVGLNSVIIPCLVSVCQFLFLSVGSLLGSKITGMCKLPPKFFSVLSGVLLFAIAFIKL